MVHLHEIKFSQTLVAVLTDAAKQGHLIPVDTSNLAQLCCHLQVRLQNLLARLEAQALVYLRQLLLLLTSHSQQILINQGQLVALQVDGLLDLLDSLINLFHVDLHAKDALLQTSQNHQKIQLRQIYRRLIFSTYDHHWDHSEAKNRRNRSHLGFYIHEQAVRFACEKLNDRSETAAALWNLLMGILCQSCGH